MPNRILRDGINSSPRVNALSMGAEILYRRLMSVVDDYGRFHGSPITIQGACWPTSPDRVAQDQIVGWLGELQSGERPLIKLYEVLGCKYLEISDFNQKARTKSRFPECPQSAGNLSADCQQNASTRRSAYCVGEGVGDVRSAQLAGKLAEIPRKESPNGKPIPPDAEKRVRALAEQAPDPQDFQFGIENALHEISFSANPELTLATMEANIPLWWAAMLDRRAKCKTLRYLIQDKDYLRKPREPTKPQISAKQTERDAVWAEVLRD